MKEKRGFTLVELLAVLVLLAVIGLITVPTVNKLIKNAKSNARAAQIQLIEKAARSWASENTDLISESSTYYLEVQTLLDDNYLQEESLVDPEDSTKSLDQCVRIFYDNGYNAYQYTYSNCAQNVDTDCFAFDSANQQITGYNFDDVESCPMDVVIPEAIEGTNVKYIAAGAFNGLGHKNKLTSVDFSQAMYLRRIYNSETDETEGAFANNLITFVDFGNIPEFYYIGHYAFYNNDLTSIDFTKAPALQTINEHSFEGNQLLTVNLSNLPALTEVDTAAFAYNNISGEIKIENSPLLNYIGEYSFEYNNIAKLVFNDLPELLQIESESFYGNIIKNLEFNNLPKLAGIRSRAFEDNNISTLKMSVLPSLNYIGSETFKDNPISTFDFSKTPNLVTISDSAFESCKLNGTLDLSMLTNLQYIGEYSFSYNYYTSINWGSINKLTTIGGAAFLYNSLNNASAFVYGRNADGTVDNTTLVSYGGSRVKTTNITIPSNVRTIGPKAFRYTFIESLASGTLNNITYIAPASFTGNNLSDSQAFIYKKNSDASYDYTTIVSYGGIKIDDVKIPSTVVTIADSAFWNNYIQSIDLTTAPNLTYIGTDAFRENFITSVTIPSTVTTIGDNAFYRSFSNEWDNITVLGDVTRFNTRWTTIGFISDLLPVAYTVYANGTPVYFNPVTGAKCTAGEAVSTTGTKTGCMKWHVFNDTWNGSSTVNLILDHNTTATVAWNSSGLNSSGPLEALTQLSTDTSSWAGVPTRTDSYSFNNGSANYTINYNGYKARFITASEIATITGKSGFNSSTTAGFYLETNTSTAPSPYIGTYKWLYNYTSGCTSYGCSIADPSTSGYWTSTAGTGNDFTVWDIEKNCRIANTILANTSNRNGLRPVITISKSKL